MAYLCDTYDKTGKLYPKDTKKRAIVNQYMNYDLGTAFRNVRAYGFPEIILGKTRDTTVEEELNETFQDINDHLCSKTYLTGDDVTICDFAMATSLTFLDLIKYDFTPYPKLKAWLDRMRQLPYWKEDHDRMTQCHARIVARRLSS